MSTKIIMKLQLLLKSKSVSSVRVTKSNHRSRHLVTVCFRNLGHVPSWSSNDSPVGGADAKHQIVIGLFVLGSLKIPQHLNVQQAARLVMLDGGNMVIYPSWGSQKWVPKKNIQMLVTFQIEPFFISMIVGGRVNLLKFGLD